MTPKEKAEQLFFKYRNLENNDSFINNYNAKQCALIAVDEILKSISYVNWLDEKSIDFKPFFNYWQEVKQEIEKL